MPILGAMSIAPKRPKRPRDLNQLAKAIVDEATGNAPEVAPDMRDPAAVALGAKGARKGGESRALKLTPARRSEIAKRAAAKRWNKRP